MDFKEYELECSKTAAYPVDKELEYLALGLVNEAGEVAGKIKKWLRGDYELTPEIRETIGDEIGDVSWYNCKLAVALLGEEAYEEIHKRNIAKLRSRKERGVIKGDGDKR